MRGRELWVALAVGALLLAACAAPSRAPADAPAEPDKFVSGLSGKLALACDAGKEHWRSPGTPKRGGVYKQAGSTNAQLPHLDVSVAGSVTLGHLPQVYRHLVKSRSCFYEDTEIVPDLAESWQISPDGLTWTLKLRRDVRWQNKAPVNGRAFTSADVGWTIDHQKAGGLMRSYYINVTHEEPDPYTIVLRLREPDADFLGKLEERFNVMFPREVKEQYGDFKTAAIGMGPFMVKRYDATTVFLERNPDWKEMGADGKPLPYIDEIQAIAFGDKQAEIAAFRAGQLDQNGLQSFGKLDYDAIMQALPKSRGYVDYVAAQWGVFFNLKSKPWGDDVRLRKAVARAIDPSDMIAAYRGGAIHTGFIPSAILKYAWAAEKAAEKFKPDREAAKKLLADAGYGPGQLKFVLKTSPTEIPQGELIQKQLQAVGMDPQLEVTQVHTSTVMQRGEYDIAWGAVSPGSFLVDRWLSGALHTNGQYNVSRVSDPKLDALTVAQRQELNLDKRKQIINEIQDYMYETMPYVPTVVINYFRIQSCQIKNMKPDHQTPNLDGLANAWLDPSAC